MMQACELHRTQANVREASLLLPTVPPATSMTKPHPLAMICGVDHSQQALENAGM